MGSVSNHLKFKNGWDLLINRDSDTVPLTYSHPAKDIKHMLLPITNAW